MIRFENVSYTYPFREEKAVTDISFQIQAGEAVLCTGMSGCGKSTLVRMINGLIPHFYKGSTAGLIRVNGQNSAKSPIHEIARDVGTLFQDPEQQFFTLNVADELAFAHEWRGECTESIRRIVDKAADKFDLQGLLDKNILSLSEGEKQKVALAAIVSLNPKILVLDEPSANLDPEATMELARVLKQLKRDGITIFVADHRLYWLHGLVDRVLVMSNGRMVWDGDYLALDRDECRQKYGLRNTRVPDETASLPRVAEGVNAAIEIRGLRFAYGQEPPLFKTERLELPAGEVIAVLGKNGAGKTTFARLITGLQKMDRGAIYMDDRPVSPRKMLRRGSIVLQNADHQLHMKTVHQELAVAAKCRKWDGKAEHVRELLQFFGLQALSNRHPQSLSGGQKQRLVIACAMIQEPDILILDEPTSGLDGINMRLIARSIRKLADNGACVLVISHDLELVDMACSARLHIPFEGRKNTLR